MPYNGFTDNQSEWIDTCVKAVMDGYPKKKKEDAVPICIVQAKAKYHKSSDNTNFNMTTKKAFRFRAPVDLSKSYIEISDGDQNVKFENEDSIKKYFIDKQVNNLLQKFKKTEDELNLIKSKTDLNDEDKLIKSELILAEADSIELFKAVKKSHVIEGVCSTTDIDADFERMAPSAIKSMVDSAKTNRVPLMYAHKKEVLDDLGEFMDASMDDTSNRMFVKFTLNDFDEDGMAKKLWGKLKKGKKIGFSVGGVVKDWIMNLSPELNKNIRTFTDINLEEVSITGSPSNPSTFVNALSKSARIAEKMEKEKASYKPGDFVSYEHTDGETYKGEIQEVKSEDDVSVPGSDGIVASTSEEDPSALINVYEVSEDGSYKSTNNYHSHNISSLTPIKSLKNMNSDVMDDGAIGAPDTTPDLGIELSTNETEKAKLPTSRRDDLPDSSFAYVSPDGKTRKMPIHDASHVRNAIARFNQADIPASAKGKAWKKILAAAKKFSVEVSEEHAPKSFKEVIGNFVTKVGEYKVKLAEADFDSLLPVLFTKYTDEARISPTMFAKLTATVLPTVDLEPSVSMYATLSPNASIDKYLGDVGVGNHDYGQELNMDYEEPGEEEDEPEEDNPVAEAVEESEERQAAYAQWQKVSQACWAASDVFSDNPDHFQEVLADLVEVLNSLMIGKSKFKAELVDKEDIVKFGEGKTMTYKEAFTYVLDSFTKEINTHNKVQEELTKKIEGLTSEVTHYKSKPVYKETLKYVQHASNPDGEDNGINKTSGKVLNQTLQTFLYDSAFDVEKKYSEDEAVEFYKNKKGLSADLFQPIQTIRSCFKS